MNEAHDLIKDFILAEFLPGEPADLLTDATPLVTGGILDSIATMKLVAFLEEQFRIKLEAYEMSVDHLNTLTEIVQLVDSKRTH